MLISAASSSTGLAAIQLANLIGAIPIALTRTNAKRQRLLEAGAAHVAAYDEDDMVAEGMRITESRGARVAFDPVGGSLLPSAEGHAVAAHHLSIRSARRRHHDDPCAGATRTNGHYKGWIVADLLADLSRMNAAVAYVQEALEAGKIRPVTDFIFEFDQMVEAHRYLEPAQQFGKIVVTVAER